MLQLGIVHPSSSCWASPLHMVPKKTPETCVPVATIVLSITAPSLTVILSLTYRTSPPLVPQSSAILTLCVHITRSLWSLTTFQKLLSSLPLGYLNSYGCHLASGMQVSHFNVSWIRFCVFCFGYIDDLLVASTSPEEHVQHLRLVLERLATHGLSPSTQPSASLVFPHLIFLAIMSAAMVSSPWRTMSRPSATFLSQRKLRQFIGLVNFYRQFLPDCAAIMQPLNQLLSHPKDKSTNPYMDRRGCVSIQQDQGCSC